ncbi:hypothetical protein J1605_000557 [Eschrichtius robustus]|uniref:Uncharacterized protein n=1 Tax=Eschrichtius robustus TaxID=9764 RepID=A0AB34GTE7_ESCRO|nr:hypothetical protein J1605_000557 [Eschrichtius robustus]
MSRRKQAKPRSVKVPPRWVPGLPPPPRWEMTEEGQDESRYVSGAREPKVPRPLSSPNSLDDLWPEPSSALKSSFPGGLRGKAQGPLLPSCQPCSWLE